MMIFSPIALDYFRTHGIDPEIPARLGVRERDGEIVFPCIGPDGAFERRRPLNGNRTLQPPGVSLALWWPAGKPRERHALVCEGESDALAAITALRTAPLPDFHELPVTAIPGTGFPADRLGADLQAAGVREAWLCFDADRAGRDYLTKSTDALNELGIRAIPVHLPDGTDLADNVAREADPGDWLANLLIDAENAEHEARQADLDVLEPVERFIRRFVVLGDHESRAIALWVVHTHAIEAAEATPYLSITSAEKESGKTRLLEVLELLVARPWLTGRVTAAVLARKVDHVRPTLLLDESDAAFRSDREYAEALRGLLNTGYRRGGKASVCVGQGANITFKDLSTFCPKAIAGIGKLPDTVASRSIPIRLSRKSKDEQVARFRRRHVEPQSKSLRERLEKFAEDYQDSLANEPDVPPELGDRAADCWEPLLAIADSIGSGWPARARAAAVALSGERETEDDSIGVQLLADIAQAFGDRDRVPTDELVRNLKAIEESPWGAWGSRRREPGLTARDLASLLRPYEIRSRSIRLADGHTPKGFLKKQFDDAWKRYVPALRAVTDATTPHPAPYPGFDHSHDRHNGREVAAQGEPNVALQAECGGVAANDRDRDDHGDDDHRGDEDHDLDGVLPGFSDLPVDEQKGLRTVHRLVVEQGGGEWLESP
jgi:hypothetical protein